MAEWSQIAFENKQFKFKPKKTKQITGVDLILPLSAQVVSLLREL